MSLAELVVALAIGITVTGVAVPMMLSGLDDLRVAGAARYLATRCALARMEAVKRSRIVALQFEPVGNDYRFRLIVDGNGNGVRSGDITRGIDRPLGPAEQLCDHFAGVSLGLLPHAPLVDGTLPDSDDGLRFGRSRLASFTAVGTASSGTAYIRGRRGAQLAVRVLGATARTRVLRYNAVDQVWTER